MWATSMRSIYHHAMFHQKTVHTPPDRSEKDLYKIVKELVKAEVFSMIPRRKHKSFSTIEADLIRTLNKSAFKQWMIDHYASVIENKH